MLGELAATLGHSVPVTDDFNPLATIDLFLAVLVQLINADIDELFVVLPLCLLVEVVVAYQDLLLVLTTGTPIESS